MAHCLRTLAGYLTPPQTYELCQAAKAFHVNENGVPRATRALRVSLERSLARVLKARGVSVAAFDFKAGGHGGPAGRAHRRLDDGPMRLGHGLVRSRGPGGTTSALRMLLAEGAGLRILGEGAERIQDRRRCLRDGRVGAGSAVKTLRLGPDAVDLR